MPYTGLLKTKQLSHDERRASQAWSSSIQVALQGGEAMSSNDLVKMLRPHIPKLIEILRDMAKNAKTKSARDAARKVLQSRGINVD